VRSGKTKAKHGEILRFAQNDNYKGARGDEIKALAAQAAWARDRGLIWENPHSRKRCERFLPYPPTKPVGRPVGDSIPPQCGGLARGD